MIKKFLFISILLVNSVCLAKTPSCGEALNWWARKNGQINPKIATQELKNGEWVISKWDVPGVAKPTAEEIQKILDDYSQWLATANFKSLLERIEELEKKVK